jgi:hypothetical protein
MINPARWDRVRDDIDFRDLVTELTGESGPMICCPFHPDRTPSFRFYPHNNDGWCFGCPPREQYFDNVRFVAKHLSISRTQALIWLEKTNNLTQMPDVEGEEQDWEEVSITFADLSEVYIIQAKTDIQATKDLELAEQYIQRYCEGHQADDPLPLARVLDPETLERVKRRKLRS